MNKKVITIVIVLIIVVVVGYLVLNKDKGQDQIIQQDGSDGASASLLDLFKKGDSVKCVFDGKDEAGSFAGTSYIGEGKARQDMELVEGAKKTDMHVILADGWTYIWSSDQPGQGIKASVDLNQQEEADWIQNLEQNQADLIANNQGTEDDVNYKCSPWQVDKKTFEPPADVVFEDMMAGFIEQGSGQGLDETNQESDDSADYKSALEVACQSCDSSEEPETCRTVLSCD